MRGRDPIRRAFLFFGLISAIAMLGLAGTGLADHFPSRRFRLTGLPFEGGGENGKPLPPGLGERLLLTPHLEMEQWHYGHVDRIHPGTVRFHPTGRNGPDLISLLSFANDTVEHNWFEFPLWVRNSFMRFEIPEGCPEGDRRHNLLIGFTNARDRSDLVPRLGLPKRERGPRGDGSKFPPPYFALAYEVDLVVQARSGMVFTERYLILNLEMGPPRHD